MCGDPAGLDADHVARLEALGALQQIELHGFAFIERAIPVFLNGGEVYEDILPGGALDKTVPFGPVKPLNCALLSHKVLLSQLSLFELLPPAPAKPQKWCVPLMGRRKYRQVSSSGW